MNTDRRRDEGGDGEPGLGEYAVMMHSGKLHAYTEQTGV